MSDEFIPLTAFEGWIKKAIEEIEKDLIEQRSNWTNHLRHHEILESRLIVWGVALVGISSFIGWIIRGLLK